MIYSTFLTFWDRKICLLIWFFTSHQQSFSYVGTGLPGLNQYKARINVSCSRTQRSDAGEARTCGPSVSSQALYHWATALPIGQEDAALIIKRSYIHLKLSISLTYFGISYIMSVSVLIATQMTAIEIAYISTLYECVSYKKWIFMDKDDMNLTSSLCILMGIILNSWFFNYGWSKSHYTS